MKLTKTFEYIESLQFAINFSVISGYRIFQQALEEDEMLRALIDYAKRSVTKEARVVNRLRQLAEVKTDPDIEHPHDIALAAYLFVLSKVDAISAYVAAKELPRLPNLWWTQRLAKTVVESMSTVSAQTVVEVPTTHSSPAEPVKVSTTSPTMNIEQAVIRFPASRLSTLRPPATIKARAS
jgi:hypothetical protein